MGLEAVGDSSPSTAETCFRELDDVFLQTQTRIWLGEVLQIRLDEQLKISDLLADGELLFEVSIVIWKMLLTKSMELRHMIAFKYKPFASKKSSGRYLPYSNVDSFLKICKIVGLTGVDLFSPSDVVEKRNARSVCMCIRSLSKKARSKHLNIPDFDIVTYTVSMPTNMVGFIRRSLELSQCRFLRSASYSLENGSKMKPRKKSSAAARARSCDFYSEDYDETESNFLVAGSHNPSTNDSASQMDSNFENLGVSSAVRRCTWASDVLQSDIQDQEKDEYAQDEYELPCLAKSVGTRCSKHVRNNNPPDSMSSPSCLSSQFELSGRASDINNGVRHNHQNDALDSVHNNYDCASIGGYSVDDNTGGKSYMVHCGVDNNDSFLTDGEDGMYNVDTYTESCGSNSTQETFENGFERRLSDDIEDAEVSSTVHRVLNSQFEDQFDTDNVLNTVNVEFAVLQSGKTDLFNKSCVDTYESQASVNHEKSQLDMKLEDINSMDGDDVVKSDPDTKEHFDNFVEAVYSNDTIEIAREVSNAYLNTDDGRHHRMVVQDINGHGRHIPINNPFITPEKHACLTSECSENLSREGDQACTDHSNNLLYCAENMDSNYKDESKHESTKTLEVEVLDESVETQHKTNGRRPLLKSVMGGTALVGVVLFFLHLRRSPEKTEEASTQSSQTTKAKGVKFLSREEQKNVRENGVYPAEKLKFGN